MKLATLHTNKVKHLKSITWTHATVFFIKYMKSVNRQSLNERMYMLNFLTEMVKSAVNPDFFRLAIDFTSPSFISPINRLPFSGTGLLAGILELRFFTTAMTE